MGLLLSSRFLKFCLQASFWWFVHGWFKPQSGCFLPTHTDKKITNVFIETKNIWSIRTQNKFTYQNCKDLTQNHNVWFHLPSTQKHRHFEIHRVRFSQCCVHECVTWKILTQSKWKLQSERCWQGRYSTKLKRKPTPSVWVNFHLKCQFERLYYGTFSLYLIDSEEADAKYWVILR